MSSSFGPVNTTHPRFGECLACWEENHTRRTGFYFESRVPMINRPCGHRLLPPNHIPKQLRINRINDFLRASGRYEDYWSRRALLPDYCGELGELRIGFGLEGLCNMGSKEAEAAIMSSITKRQEHKWT